MKWKNQIWPEIRLSICSPLKSIAIDAIILETDSNTFRKAKHENIEIIATGLRSRSFSSHMTQYNSHTLIGCCLNVNSFLRNLEAGKW